MNASNRHCGGQDAAARSTRLQRWSLALLTLTCPLLAQAQISFVYTYTDPAGVGFNDAALGAARKASLEQTGALLSSYFPGYTATISISVDGAETTDGVLAAAGSNFNLASVCDPGFGGLGDVAIKALGGVDPNAGAVDGTVTVNFEDQTWGLGDVVAPGDFDFKSTMLHELLHAMGFSHTVNQDGTSSCSQPVGSPGAWGPYDKHLGDSATGVVIDPGTFVLDGVRWSNVVTGGAGAAGVVWRGPMGTAGNGNAPVPMFSPNPFQGGSSIAHLDDDFFTTSSLLMEAAAAAGPGTRTLSDIEVGILKDIGYTNVTNTPGGGGGDRVFYNGFE